MSCLALGSVVPPLRRCGELQRADGNRVWTIETTEIDFGTFSRDWLSQSCQESGDFAFAPTNVTPSPGNSYKAESGKDDLL